MSTCSSGKGKCAGEKANRPYSLDLACEALEAEKPPYWMSEEAPTVGSDPISRAALPFVEAALRKAISGMKD